MLLYLYSYLKPFKHLMNNGFHHCYTNSIAMIPYKTVHFISTIPHTCMIFIMYMYLYYIHAYYCIKFNSHYFTVNSHSSKCTCM